MLGVAGSLPARPGADDANQRARRDEHARRSPSARRARILQASTSEVYGDPEVASAARKLLGPRQPDRACAAATTKASAAPKRCFSTTTGNIGLDIKVVRIFNTYGPRMNADDGRVVSNFIVQALRGDDVTLYGDGSRTRSFCCVDDLIEALLAAMDAPAGFTGPVNACNPAELSMRELAERVLRLTGSASRIVHRRCRRTIRKCAGRTLTSQVRALGWQPKVTLDDGLVQTIAYFRAQLNA